MNAMMISARQSATMVVKFALLALVTSATTAVAQTVLDTGRVAFTTQLVRRIAPAATDKWEFSRVRDVAVDSRGLVYALEDVDQTIRVFSSDGHLIRVLGRQGSGPGEFTHAYSLQVVGDTLWVTDTRSRRLTPFSTATGKLLKNSRAGPASSYIMGLSPIGAYVAAPDRETAPTSMHPVTYTVTHEQSASPPRRGLAKIVNSRPSLSYTVYGDGQQFLAAKKRVGDMHTSQPFDDVALYHVAPDGRSVVIIERAETKAPLPKQSVTGRGNVSVRILKLGYRGDTLMNARYLTPAIPLTAAHIASVVDSMAHPPLVNPRVRMAGVPREIRDSLYLPRNWPPTTEFFAGEDGTVWLRQPQPPAPIAKFWRIRADGGVLQAVFVPAGLRVMRVSANRIWGVRDDTDGIPTVEIHDVVPVGRHQ